MGRQEALVQEITETRQRHQPKTEEKRNYRYVYVCVFTAVFILSSLFTFIRATLPSVHAAMEDWTTYLGANGGSDFNSAETLITASSSPHLKFHWKYTTGSFVTTQVVTAHDLLYFGSWDGYEYSLQPNGTLTWRTYLGQTRDTTCGGKHGVASTAAFSSLQINGRGISVIFVGGGDGNLYALNATTGSIVWKTLLSHSSASYLWSSPVLFNGSVYIGISSLADCPLVQGQLVQLKATTGTIQHIFNTVPIGCVGGSVWGSATIDKINHALYFATGNAGSCSQPEPYTTSLIKLSTVNLTYLDSWQVPQSEMGIDSDFGSTPTLFNATIQGVSTPLVGLVNKNGTYYALVRSSLKSGPIWKATIAVGGDCPDCGKGSISSSAWDGTTLYVAGGATKINEINCKGSLRALNPATGAFLWQHCMKDGAVLAPVFAVPGVVVVGEGPNLVIVAASSGHTLAILPAIASGPAFYGAPTISHGVLYAGSMNHNLYAYSL